MNPFSILDAPDFIAPWIDRFYEPADADLIRMLSAAGGSMTFPKAASATGTETLHRAEKRAVIDIDATGDVRPSAFSSRFELWALFEGWKDIPDTVRHELNRWELNRYIENHTSDIEHLRQGRTPSSHRIVPRYVLLDEAERIIRRVDRIFLWPCNCRSMMGACNQPSFTCLRFSNDRGIGWEISKEKAVDIVHGANRSGLMQSAELGLNDRGRPTGAICNCCPDCCFPHLLSQHLKVETVWPKSRYIARPKPSRCTRCGRCARRCPFHALRIEKAKRDVSPRLTYHEERCRGCGICAAGCPDQAIFMEKTRGLEAWDPEHLLNGY